MLESLIESCSDFSLYLKRQQNISSLYGLISFEKCRTSFFNKLSTRYFVIKRWNHVNSHNSRFRWIGTDTCWCGQNVFRLMSGHYGQVAYLFRWSESSARICTSRLRSIYWEPILLFWVRHIFVSNTLRPGINFRTSFGTLSIDWFGFLSSTFKTKKRTVCTNALFQLQLSIIFARLWI